MIRGGGAATDVIAHIINCFLHLYPNMRVPKHPKTYTQLIRKVNPKVNPKVDFSMIHSKKRPVNFSNRLGP